jgi:hypothetical protein
MMSSEENHGMSKIRLGMLSLALLAAASSSARADADWNWGPACGGNTFATCAAVTVNITSLGVVTMTVTNHSGDDGTYDGTVFTQLGLDNLPTTGQGNEKSSVVQYGTLTSALDITDGPTGVNVRPDWQLGTNGLSGSGIGGGVIGMDTQHGVNGAIPRPRTFQFVFTVTGWSDAYMDDAGFAIHGQAGPESCSTKLVIHDGIANQPSTNPDASCNFSATPEPVTILLLGTGLASMGGVGLVRRRKKNGDIENA